MAKKRKLLSSNITVGERGVMSVDGLRQLAESNPTGFQARTQGLIDSGEFTLAGIRDLKGLFTSLIDVEVPVHVDVEGLSGQRAIMASAFPLLVGGLMIAEVNAGYAAVPTIGQELVTERDDNKKVSVIAGITNMDKDTDRVLEGDVFPEISAGEKKAEIRSKRNGRSLSITAEAIEENAVADIVDRCNALAEIASDWVEEQTLERVTDKTGSNTSSAAEPYVYRPDGVGTALYSATANTPGAQAPSGTRVAINALVDSEDLDNARAVLAAMLNSRLKRVSIPMSEVILLVPDALLGVATKILGSEFEPGEINTLNNWGPRGQWRPRLLSSPKMDDISTTAWYLGNFRKQFIRKWKLRFEYVTLSGNTQKFLETRLAFQARIAWDVEIGCRPEYIYVVQSLSGTTYTP